MTLGLIMIAALAAVFGAAALAVRCSFRPMPIAAECVLRAASDGREVGRGADPYRDPASIVVDDDELERALGRANRELVAAQRQEIARLREALQFAVGVLTARGMLEAKVLREMFK